MSEARVPRLQVSGLSKSFGSLEVLRNLSLHAGDGEFVSILGPSGSGKSTALSILTGGDTADAGEVRVDGEPLGAERAGSAERAGAFAFMPQRDVLLPWRRMLDNATLGLEVQGLRRDHARARVRALLETFGLAGFESRYPSELSGGMRQRVALLRTVVQERDILLLDEPFGALDAMTRTDMQRWLENVWEKHRWTVVLITHDVREAVFLSDRIYVVSPRPASVVAEVEVPLPRPRTLRTFADPAAARIEADLLEVLLAPAPRV